MISVDISSRRFNFFSYFKLFKPPYLYLFKVVIDWGYPLKHVTDNFLLDLFPGVIKKYPPVIINRLVKFSIIFSLVMSLVSNPSWFHLSTLHAQSGSRPQFAVSSAAMLPLDDSVLAIFIFMPAYLLNSF